MKIGAKIIRLESIDSTNNYVANLAKQGKIDSGTVVLADEQFAGKGQRGSQWSANAGENLTFSVYLENVNLSVKHQFVLTQLISLSLVDLLQKFKIKAKIKWPNDIFVGEKKIAGVLIENQLAGAQIRSSIIGVGLNVNQELFSEFSATSLLLENETRRIPFDVLLSCIDSFNEFSAEFSTLSVGKIKEKYLNQLYLFEELANYEDAKGKFKGRIIDVLDSGRIVLNVENERREYDLKEIIFG
ncbi:MAG: biotin--[acetyl-CoA-carboxylase] ligase [Fluviicola sp.]|nr:biotin--[acetyl-CoA-carboxylase] ligase [Fluviicola sp.]